MVTLVWLKGAALGKTLSTSPWEIPVQHLRRDIILNSLL